MHLVGVSREDCRHAAAFPDSCHDLIIIPEQGSGGAAVWVDDEVAEDEGPLALPCSPSQLGPEPAQLLRADGASELDEPPRYPLHVLWIVLLLHCQACPFVIASRQLFQWRGKE